MTMKQNLKEDVTMSVRYSEGFKQEVVTAYMAGDRSIPQLAVEFNVAKSSVSKWVNEYKEIAFLKKAVAFFAKEID